MNFKSGNVLEPSCGIGNFMGLVPDSMKDAKFYGIELDAVSGRIAQQLYQKNSIAVQGFEDTKLPDSLFSTSPKLFSNASVTSSSYSGFIAQSLTSLP